MQANKARNDLWMDLALVAFLIGLNVAARVLPHAPGFLPVAASALFAGRMLRIPMLAVAVPLIAMALSNAALPSEHWIIVLVGFVCMIIPAVVGVLSRRYTGAIAIVTAMVSCSLFFFVASNFAVWTVGGLYPLTLEGLTQCYIMALPFLEKTVVGDLFWTAVLFGGAWLIQRSPAMTFARIKK